MNLTNFQLIIVKAFSEKRSLLWNRLPISSVRSYDTITIVNNMIQPKRVLIYNLGTSTYSLSFGFPERIRWVTCYRPRLFSTLSYSLQHQLTFIANYASDVRAIHHRTIGVIPSVHNTWFIRVNYVRSTSNLSYEVTVILTWFTVKVGGRQRIAQISTRCVDVICVETIHTHIAPFRYAIINLQNTSTWLTSLGKTQWKTGTSWL